MKKEKYTIPSLEEISVRTEEGFAFSKGVTEKNSHTEILWGGEDNEFC